MFNFSKQLRIPEQHAAGIKDETFGKEIESRAWQSYAHVNDAAADRIMSGVTQRRETVMGEFETVTADVRLVRGDIVIPRACA